MAEINVLLLMAMIIICCTFNLSTATNTTNNNYNATTTKNYNLTFGSIIYVNDISVIRAYNVTSGKELWNFTLDLYSFALTLLVFQGDNDADDVEEMLRALLRWRRKETSGLAVLLLLTVKFQSDLPPIVKA